MDISETRKRRKNEGAPVEVPKEKGPSRAEKETPSTPASTKRVEVKLQDVAK